MRHFWIKLITSNLIENRSIVGFADEETPANLVITHVTFAAMKSCNFLGQDGSVWKGTLPPGDNSDKLELKEV